MKMNAGKWTKNRNQNEDEVISNSTDVPPTGSGRTLRASIAPEWGVLKIWIWIWSIEKSRKEWDSKIWEE